jgi:hypothetical protein
VIPTIEAHLGHWYVGGPIYLGPVILIFLWLRWLSWKEKRRKGRDEA